MSSRASSRRAPAKPWRMLRSTRRFGRAYPANASSLRTGTTQVGRSRAAWILDINSKRVTERPELSRLPGLGNVDSPQGGGPVGPLLECLGDFFEEGVHSGGLDVFDADAVDTGGSSVLTDFSPGPGKHVGAADLVVEGMEPAVWVLLGTAAKRVGEGSGPG